MARTKGSKNKTTSLTAEERIAVVDAEIEELQRKLKEKKAERKKLASQKEQEEKNKILTALDESGKSTEEILAFLKK